MSAERNCSAAIRAPCWRLSSATSASRPGRRKLAVANYSAEATRNPRVHAIMERHYSQISALFGERLATAQKLGSVSLAHDPVKLARLVGAVREGLLVMSAIGPDIVDADMRATARRMLETAARS